jgi:hypothetical protein
MSAVVPCIDDPKQFQGRGGSTIGLTAAQQSSGQPAVWTCVRLSEGTCREEGLQQNRKLKVTADSTCKGFRSSQLMGMLVP